MAQDTHLMPDDGRHVERRDCWCRPLLERTCPACGGSAPADCGRCGGEGAIEGRPRDLAEPCVVLHWGRD